MKANRLSDFVYQCKCTCLFLSKEVQSSPRKFIITAELTATHTPGKENIAAERIHLIAEGITTNDQPIVQVASWW